MLMCEQQPGQPDHLVPTMDQFENLEVSQEEVGALAAQLTKPQLTPLKISNSFCDLSSKFPNLLATGPVTPSFKIESQPDILQLMSETQSLPKLPQQQQPPPQSSQTPFTLLTGAEFTSTAAVPNYSTGILTLPQLASLITSSTLQSSSTSSTKYSRSSSPAVASHAVGKRTLSPSHKPARGRGRRHQLKHMTEAQIQEETEERAEKNRLAAKECRRRRKNRECGLRAQVSALEAKDIAAQTKIAELLHQVHALQQASLQQRN